MKPLSKMRLWFAALVDHELAKQSADAHKAFLKGESFVPSLDVGHAIAERMKAVDAAFLEEGATTPKKQEKAWDRALEALSS